MLIKDKTFTIDPKEHMLQQVASLLQMSTLLQNKKELGAL